MADIHDSEIQRLKKNVSILHVCAAHGIELTLNGMEGYVGHCPFPWHHGKEPSFMVLPRRNLWQCTACDEGGSVIGLVMRLEGISFRESVDKLMTSRLLRRGFGIQATHAAADPELQQAGRV